MTTLMQVIQISLSIIIGSAALLCAVTEPNYRPMATGWRDRLVISFCITLMVSSMPILMPSAMEFAIMLVVGTIAMYGVIMIIVGPVPHKMINNRLIDNRRPRGYRIMNNQMELQGATI